MSGITRTEFITTYQPPLMNRFEQLDEESAHEVLNSFFDVADGIGGPHNRRNGKLSQTEIFNACLWSEEVQGICSEYDLPFDYKNRYKRAQAIELGKTLGLDEDKLEYKSEHKPLWKKTEEALLNKVVEPGLRLLVRIFLPKRLGGML